MTHSVHGAQKNKRNIISAFTRYNKSTIVQLLRLFNRLTQTSSERTGRMTEPEELQTELRRNLAAPVRFRVAVGVVGSSGQGSVSMDVIVHIIVGNREYGRGKKSTKQSYAYECLPLRAVLFDGT